MKRLLAILLLTVAALLPAHAARATVNEGVPSLTAIADAQRCGLYLVHGQSMPMDVILPITVLAPDGVTVIPTRLIGDTTGAYLPDQAIDLRSPAHLGGDFTIDVQVDRADVPPGARALLFSVRYAGDPGSYLIRDNYSADLGAACGY